jgi:hypothetical protein
MITSGKAFDFAMKLIHILDYKTHPVNIKHVMRILENNEMNIVDYLENDYGNIVEFGLFDKNVRREITEFCQDRVMSVAIECKWGVKKDGISLLLACAIDLLWHVGNRDFRIAQQTTKFVKTD